MYAYDDAIHGRMGKAEEYKIFPVIHSEEKLIKLLKGKNAVKIYANGQEEQAEEFAEKLREMGRRTGDCFLPRILEGKPLSGEDSFTMAKDIFSLDDFRLSTWYVDKEGRILSSEEDVFLVINREYSRKTFVFSQKGLFMSFTDKIF